MSCKCKQLKSLCFEFPNSIVRKTCALSCWCDFVYGITLVECNTILQNAACSTYEEYWKILIEWENWRGHLAAYLRISQGTTPITYMALVDFTNTAVWLNTFLFVLVTMTRQSIRILVGFLHTYIEGSVHLALNDSLQCSAFELSHLLKSIIPIKHTNINKFGN